jgi:hypothetical protein
MTKPDFFIIGAMKSATSTLHNQLELQPGVFMSNPKEPNFFSDDDIYALGIPWYESLFEDAQPGDICGESSTHYTKLPTHPHTCERLAQYKQDAKFIYVMRHPVDRLVSHYIHQWTQNVIKTDINAAINKYEELIAYSCYSKQLKPYFDMFGRESVLPVFTEAIRANPQQQLDHVADFIGYKGNVEWQFSAPSQNVSKERLRKFKGYNLLIESRLMTVMRQNLIPKSLRNKVKQYFSMKDRPQLSSAQLEKITAIFDQDLEQLGEFLGVELNCENFKSIVENELFLFKN